jgi:hypothetical protein
MVRLLKYLLIAFTLQACAVTSLAPIWPCGNKGYYVHCSRDAADCLNVAAKVCPAGYQVVNMPLSSFVTIEKPDAASFSGEMIIECKSGASSVPTLAGK